MFGQPSAFGSASATPSPFAGFGQPAQPTATTPAFGGFGQPAATPSTAFGASTGFGATPAFGASTFGQTAATPAATAGFGGFGHQPAAAATAASTPFGANPATGFGSTPTLGGGFGATSQPAFGTGGLFGATSSSAPSAFGAPAASGGLFGAPATSATGGGLFGAGAPGSTGGLFGSATPATATTAASAFGTAPAFGVATTTGTGNPAYAPQPDPDPANQTPMKLTAITAMPAYQNKSFEELRMEDFQKPDYKQRASGQATLTTGGAFGAPAAGGAFGTPATASAGGLFGTAAGSTPSAFGGSSSTTFGATPFGSAPSAAAGGLFGAAPSTGSSLFGTPAAATASPFGAAATGTTGGLFGATPTTTGSSLFGQQPATGGSAASSLFGAAGGSLLGTPAAAAGGTSTGASTLFGGAFGSTAATPGAAATPFGSSGSGFGGFGTSSTLGQAAAPSITGGSLFGAPSAAAPSPFGAASTSAFGSTPFGASTAPTASSTLFGAAPAASPFGAAATGSSFSFGTPAAATQSTPAAAGSLFGGTGFGTPATATTTGFGTPGGLSFGTFGTTTTAATGAGGATAAAVPSLFGPGAATAGGGAGAFNFGGTALAGQSQLQPQAANKIASLQAPQPFGAIDKLPSAAVAADATITPTGSASRVKKAPTPAHYHVTPLSHAKMKPRGVLLGGRKPGTPGSATVFDDGTPTTTPEALLVPRHSLKRLVVDPAALLQATAAAGSMGTGTSTGTATSSSNTNGGSGTSPASAAGDHAAGGQHQNGGLSSSSPAATPGAAPADAQPELNAAATAAAASAAMRRPVTAGGTDHQQPQRSVAAGPGTATGPINAPLRPTPKRLVATEQQQQQLQEARRRQTAPGSDLNASVSSDASADVSRLELSHAEDSLYYVDEVPQLRRRGYYTVPSIEELRASSSHRLAAVPDFTVGLEGVGSVRFLGTTDVRGLDLDAVINFLPAALEVYPDETTKPARGQKLNKPAVITLEKLWPTDRDKTTIKTDDASIARYTERIRRSTEKLGAHFINYDPKKGEWVFQVDHFSRYGLMEDDDDADDGDVTQASAAAVSSLPSSQQGNRGAIGMSHNRLSARVTGSAEAEPLAESSRSGGISRRQAASRFGLLFGETETGQHNAEVGRADEADGQPATLHEAEGSDNDDLDSIDDTAALETGSTEADSSAGDDGAMELDDLAAPPASGGVMAHIDEAARRRPLDSSRLYALRSILYDESMRRSGSGKPRGALFGDTLMSTADAQDGVMTDQSAKRARSKSLHDSTPALAVPQLALLPTVPAETQPSLVLQERTVADSSQQPRIGVTELTVLRPRGMPTAHQVSQLTDPALFMGRSFRASWAPGGLLAHPGHRIGTPAGHCSFNTVALERLHVSPLFAGDAEHAARDIIEPLLEVHAECSRLLDDEGHDVKHKREQRSCGFLVLDDVDGLMTALMSRVDQLLESDAVDVRGNRATALLKSCQAALQLAYSLWGRDCSGAAVFAGLEPALTDVPSVEAVARRRSLSQWLQQVAASRVKVVGTHPLDDAFEYLSAKLLPEAVAAATSGRDLRLATLVSQASGATSLSRDTRMQLESWIRSGAIEHIPKPHLRLYRLLAMGCPPTQTARRSDDIRYVMRGLDWQRCIAMHMWYGCEPDAAISEVVSTYDDAVAAHASAPPLPGYLEAQPPLDAPASSVFASDDGSIFVRDKKSDMWYRPGDELAKPPGFRRLTQKSELAGCLVELRSSATATEYKLIKLYCDRTYPLTDVVAVDGYSPFALDAHLSWLLYSILRGLNYPATSRALLVAADFAAELDLLGLWHWAVYVLLHLDRSIAHIRDSAIMDIIARHAPALDDVICRVDGYDELNSSETYRDFLTRRLHIPDAWLDDAMAWWSRSCGESYKEVAYLSRSGSDWERVHDLVVSVLAPDCLLRAWAAQNRATVADSFFRDKLYDLLTGVEQVEQQGTPVRHWASRGSVFLEYLRVEQDLRLLVQQQASKQTVSSDDLLARLDRLSRRTRQLGERVAALEISRRQAHAAEEPGMAQALRPGHVVVVRAVDRLALQELACLTDMATRVSQFMFDVVKMKTAVECSAGSSMTDDDSSEPQRLHRSLDRSIIPLACDLKALPLPDSYRSAHLETLSLAFLKTAAATASL